MGADAFVAAEGNTDALHWPGAAVPSGSLEQGMPTGGLLGTWEALSFPPRIREPAKRCAQERYRQAKDDEVRRKGRAHLVRYADDAVLIFSSKEDALRVMDVLPKRFGKYGLTLHPKKTRLIDFRKPGFGLPQGWRPGTFDLLGFTHHWAKSRKGAWVVKRKTASDRFSRSLKAIKEWCRANRHQPVGEQHMILSMKLRGHCGYYGITGNSYALQRFDYEVNRIWKKWLGKRSQHRRPWDWFNNLLRRFPLPPPLAIHSTFQRVANP